ncbi:DUF58 domain-containing protein [Candidatus Collierbacteria bacterium]|nr:DUF58 domain-containing protein [Candidatus Collierbacteria bacterium]
MPSNQTEQARSSEVPISNRPENPIRLQQIQYWINWLSAGFATGKWDSVFLGRGFDFQGVAPFTDDPDMIRINWQATLTSGELQVSQFSEERNINIYLLGDMGPSMAFGTEVTKQDRLALLAAIISFSALRMKDAFHYIGFTDRVERGLPHRMDTTYPLILAESIMEFDWRGRRNTGLPTAALEVTSNRSFVIIISDFLGDLEQIENSLKILAPRHAVLPIVVWDEREVALPETGWGLYPLRDLETEQLSYVFLTGKTREKFKENSRLRLEALQALFSRFGIQPHFLIGGDTNRDVEALVKIFLLQHSQF